MIATAPVPAARPTVTVPFEVSAAVSSAVFRLKSPVAFVPRPMLRSVEGVKVRSPSPTSIVPPGNSISSAVIDTLPLPAEVSTDPPERVKTPVVSFVSRSASMLIALAELLPVARPPAVRLIPSSA